jgi:hypothetical protein
MLAEWFAYLTTPCPRHLRRMGYLREVIGTRSRFRRCHETWRPHLQKTKAAILAAARRTPNRRKAVVLGSGWLYDIPLRQLSTLFGEVVLADILHMPQVGRAVARYSNVRLLNVDVTGAVKPQEISLSPALMLPDPVDGLPEADADLIVSANLLSQLPYLPMRALRRVAPGLTDREVGGIAKGLIERHLRLLCEAPGTVCLVTEVEHLYCDGETVLDRENPLYGVDPGPPDKEWIWDIAPRPELGREIDLKYRVISRIIPPAG